MPLTPEEQRALDWQRDRRLQKEFKRSLQTQLRAPGSNKVTLEKNWEPLRAVHYPITDEYEIEEMVDEPSYSTRPLDSFWRDGN